MADPIPLRMQLTTVLGPKLRFRSLSAYEEMSALFEFRVVAVSNEPNIKADDLLATAAAVSLEYEPGKKRWFHGMVASFGSDGGNSTSGYSYRLLLRPWLWLLTRSSNIRIFQDKSVKTILSEVFDSYEHQLADDAKGDYAKRVYCVQYRETDFNFISRLLEEEGIAYYFRHSEGGHQLVLSTPPALTEAFAGFADIEFLHSPADAQKRTGLLQWRMQQGVQTGHFTLSDYNFTTPSTRLVTTTAQTTRAHAEAAREHYDYPGLYANKAAGDARAAIRGDEMASRYARFSGSGNSPGVAAGSRFKLVNHPRAADQNVDYLVLQTQIDMELSGYESGDGTDYFSCQLIAQPFAEPHRPERRTSKPHVAGPQTAVVVGGGEAEGIYTDEYARVKVQFHWDRLGKKDMTSSCWIRVASPVAGSGWGMISIPRVGQEVVVDFLEGDPDQPLITGRVHNAEQLPPYELPANATVSTLKTRSKGGAVADFNELRFEDKAGSEYVLLHAQKDRIEFVEQTLNSDIGKDEHRTVKGNRKEKISGDHHVTVDKDVKQKITNALSVTTGKDMLFKSGATWGLKAAQDITAESGTAISLKAGTDMHMKVGMNLGVDAGMNVHIKAGMNLVLEAGVQISIKAGPASVVLGPSGVSITGPVVMINSGGAAGSGSGASPVAPTAPQEPDAPDPAEDPLKSKHR